MPAQSWEQLLTSQDAAGALYNTFTTAKTVINQSCLVDFPRNYFQSGNKLRVTVFGGLSNIVTTPGTVTFQVMLGSIVVWTSGAIQMNATAHTLLPFRLVVDLTCQLQNTTVGGAVAKFMGQGLLVGTHFTLTAGSTDSWGRSAAADNPVSHAHLMVPVTAPALGTAFDGTIAQTLDFWTGFSISNAGNGIQIAQYDVEEYGRGNL